MPNVELLSRLGSEEAYVAEMRRSLQTDPKDVRAGYAQLVEKLAELTSTERLLREEVLSQDEPSTSDRLRGVLLLYNRVGLEAREVRLPSPAGLDDGQMTSRGISTVKGLVEFPWPSGDSLFAISASYKFWLYDSHARFCVEAAEAYGLTVPQIDAVTCGVFVQATKDIDEQIRRLYGGDSSRLVREPYVPRVLARELTL